MQAIYLKTGPNWQCCLAGSSKRAPRILIFSIAMGAVNSFYVKSIATYAPTFFGYIISVLALVLDEVFFRTLALTQFQLNLNRCKPQISFYQFAASFVSITKRSLLHCKIYWWLSQPKIAVLRFSQQLGHVCFKGRSGCRSFTKSQIYHQNCCFPDSAQLN